MLIFNFLELIITRYNGNRIKDCTCLKNYLNVWEILKFVQVRKNKWGDLCYRPNLQGYRYLSIRLGCFTTFCPCRGSNPGHMGCEPCTKCLDHYTTGSWYFLINFEVPAHMIWLFLNRFLILFSMYQVRYFTTNFLKETIILWNFYFYLK